MAPTRRTQLNSDPTSIAWGSYNNEKFTVTLGLHPDPSLVPLILFHEFLHQRLNRHSTFGQIIEHVAHLVREGRLKKDALTELASRCDRVHETLATYNSVIHCKRRDLLVQLPNNYQIYFRDMEQALLRVPATVHWHLCASWHLSRIAMLVPIEDWENGSPKVILRAAKSVSSPNDRREIIMAEMTRFDLAKFTRLMKKWGADNSFLEAFRLEDDAAIMRKLAATKKWSGWKEFAKVHDDAFEFFVMHAFLDYFEDILPGVQGAHEDAFSHSHRDSMRYATAPGSNEDRDSKLIQSLVEACNQKVRFLPGSIRPRQWTRSSSVFRTFLENSLSKFGCLHLLVYAKRNQPVFDLVHVLQPGSGFVDHYKLNAHDWKYVLSLEEQFVAISEVDMEVNEPMLLPVLSERMYVFANLRGNPIERVEALIHGGVRKISWCRALIGHRSGPLDPSFSLEMCLYWIDSNNYPLFHLSNEMMSNAIQQYGEILQKAGTSFSVLTAEEVHARIPQAVFSRFTDHPVLNYYFFST